MAQALVRIAGLRGSGELDRAGQTVDETINHVLGPVRPVLERLEATSAVELVGKNELDRVRLYAQLLAERAAIEDERSAEDEAARTSRRALELYAAGSLAGMRLERGDRDRISELRSRVDLEQLDPKYAAEIDRILT